MTIHGDPLTAPSPAEVPLPSAPLVRVLAQVRFPLIASIGQQDFIAPFQQAIRQTYPVLRPERIQNMTIALPAGAVQAQTQTAWRFSDVDNRWRVSLTPEFLALETTAYTSRADFLARLRSVLMALEAHVDPKVIDRLGLRYIDRISGADVEDVARMVRPEVLGIAGTATAGHLQHSITESMFAIDGARLLTRWGQLPPGATVDPAAVEPIQETSWLLDLDMFSTETFPFDVDATLHQAAHYAERVYTFFRWAVTEDFLRRYGGQP